jgi:uncharacterized repeat protein (TIGR01451 family)
MLVEKTLPSQVRLGQPFDYEIKVTNTTDATLDDVRIQEQTPEGLAITASQPERQGQGADAGWQLGTLKPRESRTIKVSGKADKQGELGTCVFASYKPSLCAAVNVVNPQIKVTKIAPQQADICDNIEVPLHGHQHRQRLDRARHRPRGPARGPDHAGRPQPGGARRRAHRGGADEGGRGPAEGVARGDRSPAAPSRRATAGFQAQTDDVTLRVTQPKLAVNIEGPENEYVDRPIAYRVTVTNEGDAPARDATIAVPIPRRRRSPTSAPRAAPTAARSSGTWARSSRAPARR